MFCVSCCELVISTTASGMYAGGILQGGGSEELKRTEMVDVLAERRERCLDGDRIYLHLVLAMATSFPSLTNDLSCRPLWIYYVYMIRYQKAVSKSWNLLLSGLAFASGSVGNCSLLPAKHEWLQQNLLALYGHPLSLPQQYIVWLFQAVVRKEKASAVIAWFDPTCTVQHATLAGWSQASTSIKKEP